MTEKGANYLLKMVVKVPITCWKWQKRCELLAENDREGANYLAANVFRTGWCKNCPLAALVGSLAFSSKSALIIFYNLKSMIMQDCMMGNCRFALIHNWEHHIYIDNWISNIIWKGGMSYSSSLSTTSPLGSNSGSRNHHQGQTMQPNHYHSCYHLVPQVNQCLNNALLINTGTVIIISTFSLTFGASLFQTCGFLLVDVTLSLVQLSLIGRSIPLPLVVVDALFLTDGWHLCFVGEQCNGASKSLIWALISTTRTTAHQTLSL